MKNFKKYASAFALLLIFLLICQVISHAALFLVNTVYSALHKWFSDAFPLYSPIGDSGGYEVYSAVTGLIAYTLSLLLSVYLACLLSNAKNERLISRTEGFFTVREGFSIYLKEFILPDATASAVCSFILLFPICFIPEGFFTKDYSFFLSYQKLIFDTFGFALGVILASIVTFGLHFIAVIPAMKYWRSAWLTGFAR